jgi:hypothetical protein
MTLAACGRQYATTTSVGDERPRRFPLDGPMRRRNTKTKKLPSEAILAGLPAHVMDELVEDMAEAVVAMLLSQAAPDADEEDHASGDLRTI